MFTDNCRWVLEEMGLEYVDDSILHYCPRNTWVEIAYRAWQKRG